jgi:hypothetical protein
MSQAQHTGKSAATAKDKQERRRHRRYLACFGAEVAIDKDKRRIALVRDLSIDGALLVTRARLQKGDPVRLEMFLSPDTKESRKLTGKVVRVEHLDPEVSTLWTQLVAVQFDDQLQDMEPYIAVVAAQQAKVTCGF